VLFAKAGGTGLFGGDRIRLDLFKSWWHAVVDQWATLKADQKITANKSFALAA
jgi:hypothetical protein